MFIHITLPHSSTLHALYIEKLSTHGKLREHSNKVLHESRVNLRTLPRVCDVEGGTVCSKNNAFGYFDETGARTPRSRSPTPIFVPGLRQRKQHQCVTKLTQLNKQSQIASKQELCEYANQLNGFPPFLRTVFYPFFYI